MSQSATAAPWTPTPPAAIASRPQPLQLLPRVERSFAVPVLSPTLLGLELLLQEPSIDLRRMAELILSDLGATLHILRLAGCRDALHRMEDCLASLDVSEWFSVLADNALTAGSHADNITSAWHHASLIARYARFVAGSFDNVNAEEAYLIGLFHELDTLPSTPGCTAVVAPLAIGAVLPPFLQHALIEARRSADSVWQFILHSAHHLAADESAQGLLISVSSPVDLPSR